MSGWLSRSAVVKGALCDRAAPSGHSASQPSSRVNPHATRSARRIGGTTLPVLACAVVGVLVAGCAPALGAAPRLVAISPMPGAVLPVVKHTFQLAFNGPLDASSSWAEVTGSD